MKRRGTVLLVVLVVTLLLALGAYTFSETMISERTAASMYGRKVTTRVAADSGLEYIAAVLDQGSERYSLDLNHNPKLFQAILVKQSERARGRARFSVVAAIESDPSSSGIRFGLSDESAKLNLNTLLPPPRRKDRAEARVDRDDEAEKKINEEELNLPRRRLLLLPGMTHKLADAILDFIDQDDTTRQYGAEAEYYSGMNRRAKNGPLHTLDELLQVRGVTNKLLYGEDANRNGLLDSNEDDGEQSLPLDNADGVLQVGWSGYLTVHSREINLRANGEPRINVNQNSLEELEEQLKVEFSEEVAEFVVAFRTSGATSENTTSENNSANENSTGSADESEGGANEIESLYELFGSKTSAADGTVLESPWSSDPADMQQYLPNVLARLTTSNDLDIRGRINVNQARREILVGIPEMTESIASRIVASQTQLGATDRSATVAASRATTVWLLAEGIVDLGTMRKIDPYITARGDVFRAQIVGHFDAGGPITRVEAIIDATRRPPKIVMTRDVSALGPGFNREQLTSGIDE